MAKKRKLIISILSIIIIFFVAVFCLVCIDLTTDTVNGFVGVFHVLKLSVTGNLYTQLDKEPIRIMIRESDVNKFLIEYFNDTEEAKIQEYSYKIGRGVRNGVEYSVKLSTFSSKYTIFTIVPI